MHNETLNKNIVVIFDFDGTMSLVFKNYDLSEVAIKMREAMGQFGVEFAADKDVFDVFDVIKSQNVLSGKKKSDALNVAHAILTQAEVEAVENAPVVNGVARVLDFFNKNGIKMGVATNNSVDCVQRFMSIYCPNISMPIIGRVGDRPELMKPNTWSLNELLKEIRCNRGEVIFVGDSKRDYECAMNYGVKFIGIAPLEYKRQRLMKLISQDQIVSDFDELSDMLKHEYPQCFKS